MTTLCVPSHQYEVQRARMERARARVVKVRESRERERRDMCSSMATRERRECRWGDQRHRRTERTQSVDCSHRWSRKAGTDALGVILKAEELPSLNTQQRQM